MDGRYMLFLLFFTSCCKLLYADANSNRSRNCDVTSYHETPKHIYFAFVTTFSGSFISSGTIPAVELAIEQVNNDSLLLHGYVLNYTRITDTECDRSKSLSSFFDMVNGVPPYPLALLGMGCAVATEPVAELNSNWRLPMMGYVSAAPSLSDRSRFKSYYRTYPSDAIFVPAVMSFISYYNWKNMLIITENANTFITNDRLLRNVLPTLGVNVSSESLTFIIDEHASAIEHQIEEIVTDRDTDDPHIIFVNTFETKARIILCKFYQLGITHPSYVFITHGWYQNRWWSQEVANSSLNCSDAEMINMLHGVIAVQQFPVAKNGSHPTASGLSADEFDLLYGKKLAQYPKLKYQLEATTAFDAVWALALALDNASQSLCTDDLDDCSNARVTENIPLENYTFFNDRIECLINRSLNNLEFEGVSGLVKFDENGTRVQDEVFIQQYRWINNTLSRVTFCIVNTQPNQNNTFSYLGNESDASVWPGGVPPDGVPIQEFNGVHYAITVIYVIITITGIVFATGCFVFNLIFRKRKVIKLTSPVLNYIMVVGTIMLYLSVIAHVLPGESDTVNIIRCYLGNTLFVLGYTVAFSAVLSKIYRVYYIFHNPTIGKKKVLKDWHLLIMACTIIAVTVVLLIVENAVPTLRPHPLQVPDRERGQVINAQNVTVVYYVYSCGGTSFSHTLIQIFELVYLLLLQIIGIVFAIQTRKVKVKVLNDAKWVAAIIYSSSLCVIVIILSKFTLTGFLNFGTSLMNIAVILATTLILTLAFVPKMISLYQDPKGLKVFRKSSSGSTITSHSIITGRKLSGFGVDMVDDDKAWEEKVEKLEAKIVELEREISELKQNESNGNSEKNVTCEDQDKSMADQPRMPMADQPRMPMALKCSGIP